MKCPKCNYERQSSDDAPDWQCPFCKVAYAKVLQAQKPIFTPAGVYEQRDRKPSPSIQPDAEQDENDLHERLELASQGQKIVIYSIFFNLFLRAAERSHILPNMVLEVLFVCIAIYTLMGIVKICSGLNKSQSQKILLMVLAFYPLINLMTLVYLNIKTSKVLRDAGWKVGLFGAKQ